MARTGLEDTYYENNKRTFVFSVDDEDNPGEKKSLTNHTARFVLTTLADRDTPVLSKATGGQGITIGGDEDEEITVTVSPSDTDGLGTDNGTQYYFEVEVFDASGDGVVVATGIHKILSNVPHS